ncbi:MAG: hypothetical protein RJS98_16750 [Rhodospirillaceae bacterium]
MAEEPLYVRHLISRVAGLGAGTGAKTLIVGCAPAIQGVVQHVNELKAQSFVDVVEIAPGDLAKTEPLVVEAEVHAVLIAAISSQTMIKLGNICGAYKDSGIPVVIVTGWPPPTNAEKFRFESSKGGNLTVPAMFDLAALYCRGIQGDILEFGSFQGFTLQCAYHAFKRRQPHNKRRFISFDSFAGIVGSKDDETFSDGTYAASEKSFRFANFLADVPEEPVLTVEGPYDVTLAKDIDTTRNKIGPTKAALVHIDCDVEVPAKLALDFVTPYLQQGTLLMFDEYDAQYADNTLGERAALRRWLAENPEFEVEHYRSYHVSARSFIVHRKSA